jgi:archaellum component FlaC
MFSRSKELQESTFNQVKELNKTIQDLKTDLERIMTSQQKTILELQNQGKRSGVIDGTITNRMQEVEERISGAEDTIENIDTTVKGNAKSQNLLTPNIQEIQDTMKRTNLRTRGIEKSEES